MIKIRPPWDLLIFMIDSYIGKTAYWSYTPRNNYMLRNNKNEMDTLLQFPFCNNLLTWINVITPVIKCGMNLLPKLQRCNHVMWSYRKKFHYNLNQNANISKECISKRCGENVGYLLKISVPRVDTFTCDFHIFFTSKSKGNNRMLFQ